MEKRIPVNPKVLRWARETGGFEIDDVVERINRKRVTPSIVESWENGSASPTYAQLERLSYDIYKRPLALFFFPKPPKEETPKQSFRTLPQSEINLMEPNLLFMIRQAMAMRENLRELLSGTNPATNKICTDIQITTQSVPETAKAVRKYLNIDLKEQYSLRSNDDAFKYWRNLLEEHGVFVFKNAFKDDDCSGFCLYDDVFPIIYVNNSHPKIRQIFTLFHELAHLLFRTGGVDLRHEEFVQGMRGTSKHIEVFCNKFAGEFLVPTDDLNRFLQQTNIDDKLLTRLAKRYSVSREVILRKCLDLNYIDQSFYEAKVRVWERERTGRAVPGSGGDYYLTQGAYLGDRYIGTVFSKYYQGVISKPQLAEYLGTKEANVPGFEDRLLSRK